MSAVISWLVANWMLVSVILIVLATIAEYTKWKWDDQLVEVLRRIINLLTPGKRLYTQEEIKEKTPEQIEQEEKEYQEKGALGRIWLSIKGLFRCY